MGNTHTKSRDRNTEGPQIDGGEEEEEDLARPIVKNGRYYNPFSTWEDVGFTSLFKFLYMEKNNSSIPWDNPQELDETLPIVKPDYNKLENPPKGSTQVMWIGHASVLVQFDGLTVLTDPVLGKRCGPFGKFGPKRYRDPPCTIEELPHIDAIVISHNHYDHLEHDSVVKLNRKFGDSVRWYVGEGTKAWMESVGCKNVVELTWWQEDTLTKDGQTFTFAATPAQHWCKRTATDTNKALWCSWVVKGPRHSFYFAGDTGYCSAFKQIGRKYGPISVSAIPIGAYEPRWFMRPQHVNPEEAVQVHVDVRSQISVGIHWGTYPMTYEHYMEPKTKLADIVRERGIGAESFITVKHGDVVTLPAQTDQH